MSVKTAGLCCDIGIQWRSLKLYEWIKLSEYYHQAKFDIYHVYSVHENCKVKAFVTCGQLDSWQTGLTLIITDFHFPWESKSMVQQMTRGALAKKPTTKKQSIYPHFCGSVTETKNLLLPPEGCDAYIPHTMWQQQNDLILWSCPCVGSKSHQTKLLRCSAATGNDAGRTGLTLFHAMRHCCSFSKYRQQSALAYTMLDGMQVSIQKW